MPLLSIRVVIPVSACSNKIRTEGQITGSLVRVMADGVVVAEAEATSASALIDLLPGFVLQPGQGLTATQTFEGETSAPSPEPVIVQAAPPELGLVGVGDLFSCSECVHVGGVLPGFNVRVSATSGPAAGLRGESDIAAITAQVEIFPPAQPDETLLVSQGSSVCGLASGSVPITALNGPPAVLPPPAIEQPLKACQSVLRFRDVIPGATVTVERGSGEISGCVAGTGGHWGIAPLVAGEAIRIKQAFPRCEVVGEFSDPHVVEDAEPIQAPMFSGLYSNCTGAQEVILKNLVPTARIRILQDGQSIGMGEVPPNQTSMAIPVESLASNVVLTAQQNLCGIWGPASDPMIIRDQEPNIPAPEIPGPLFPCAAAVRVSDLFGWLRVTVHSSILAAPIGQVVYFATSGEVDVPVAPLLLPGDTITASIRGCGAEEIFSEPVTVAQGAADVNPPQIDQAPIPLQVGMTAIPVTGVIPGARVDALVNGDWRGGAVIGGTTGHVAIYGALILHDAVVVRQRMCARTSPVSDPAFAQHKIPVAAFTAHPTSGVAPLEVQFRNQSSNANHPTEPFEWFFDDQGNGSGPTSGEAEPSHTYDSEGTFVVTLVAKNGSGFEQSLSRTVTVQPAADDTDDDHDNDDDDGNEVVEEEVVVSLVLVQPPIFEGFRPYLGYSSPRADTILTRIENPTTTFFVGFVKAGHSTTECGDEDAVFVVPPGGEIGTSEFEEIWNEAEPPGAYPHPSGFGHVGRYYLACIGTLGSLDDIPDFINIRAYFVPAS